MIQEISILIPVYNDDATSLVYSLYRQAQAILGLSYEIVVFDDGSTDNGKILRNKALRALPCCRYIYTMHHDCRAAMRNAMYRQGKYEWHIMVDARLSLLYDDFLLRYLKSDVGVGEVVCGGVCVDGGRHTKKLYQQNLRFRYEKYEERNHTVDIRRSNPYNAFRTTNFFYHKSVLEKNPYDERVKGYGYEDVLLGKALKDNNIKVIHIDNPVTYTEFESNTSYMRKIQEALETLHTFSDELEDYSPLLCLQKKMARLQLLFVFRFFHRLFGKMEYKNLCGHRPLLFIFKLYKLGFYINIDIQ